MKTVTALLVILVAFPIVTLPGTAQHLVADINQVGNSSSLRSVVASGDRIFFVANDGLHGLELWTSDGTESGTVLLVDFTPGPDGSSFENLTDLGDGIAFSDRDSAGVVFVVDDRGVVRELIRSTGEVGQLHVRENELFGVVGGALFMVDLTSGLSSEIVLDAGRNPRVQSVHALPDRMAVVAKTSAGGPELWTVDWQSKEVAQVFSGPADMGSRNYVVSGSRLFFSGWTDGSGAEVWVSNLEAGGTHVARHITPGAGWTDFVIMGAVGNGVLMCLADPDRLYGVEPWFSDGTEAGTYMIVDSYEGPLSSIDTNESIAPIGDGLLFVAKTELSGQELWFTDGTPEGTFEFADIEAGALSSSPMLLGSFGGRAFFSALTAENGRELYVVDSHADGTVGAPRLLDTFTGPGGGHPGVGAAMNGVLYFGASNAVSGSELWRSDGTTAGTWMVKDIHTSGNRSSSLGHMHLDESMLYFIGNDGIHGRELWETDGTSAGTALLHDLTPGEASTSPSLFASSLNGTIIAKQSGARVDNGRGSTSLEYHLFSIDRSTGDATRVIPGSSDRAIIRLQAPMASEGQVHILIDSNDGARELWITDGTQVGTRVVSGTEIECCYEAKSLGWVGDRHVFHSGGTLWAADMSGQAASSFFDLPTDVLPRRVRGPFGEYVAESDILDDAVLFTVQDRSRIFLWRSDLTADGTWQVAKLDDNPTLTPLEKHDGSAYLAYTHPNFGRELWQSQGMENDLQLTVDVNPGMASSDPEGITSVGPYLAFSAIHDSFGRELWYSDGTVDGTKLAGDIVDGPTGSDPVVLGAFGEFLLFSADDGVHGRELWMFDTRNAAVTMLADIEPGPGSSEPRDLIVGTTEAYFTAETSEVGRELWRLDIEALVTGLAEQDHRTESFSATAMYPNPFGAEAAFELSVARDQGVSVMVYDVLGRHVRTLFDGLLSANSARTYSISGDGLATGMYFVKVRGEDFATTRTVIRSTN